jgi:hypothetical protein
VIFWHSIAIFMRYFLSFGWWTFKRFPYKWLHISVYGILGFAYFRLGFGMLHLEFPDAINPKTHVFYETDNAVVDLFINILNQFIQPHYVLVEYC